MLRNSEEVADATLRTGQKTPTADHSYALCTSVSNYMLTRRGGTGKSSDLAHTHTHIRTASHWTSFITAKTTTCPSPHHPAHLFGAERKRSRSSAWPDSDSFSVSDSESGSARAQVNLNATHLGMTFRAKNSGCGDATALPQPLRLRQRPRLRRRTEPTLKQHFTAKTQSVNSETTTRISIIITIIDKDVKKQQQRTTVNTTANKNDNNLAPLCGVQSFRRANRSR